MINPKLISLSLLLTSVEAQRKYRAYGSATHNVLDPNGHSLHGKPPLELELNAHIDSFMEVINTPVSSYSSKDAGNISTSYYNDLWKSTTEVSQKPKPNPPAYIQAFFSGN